MCDLRWKGLPIHIDFDATDFDTFDSDVCIIGAGVAGIALAERLLASGRSVTILESGGPDYDPATAQLNAGKNVGEEYYPLDHARLRLFGGTAAIWGGRIAELDPIDFEKRAWVPHSGWPIGYDDLRDYYREARTQFGLPPEKPGSNDLQSAGVDLPAFDGDQLDLRLWTFDMRIDRFTFSRRTKLLQHPRCKIFTYATVTRIDTDPEGAQVTGLEVQSLHGRRATFHARSYILAAGGIENPRLLLASGVGNAHDLVGRFFMEHPHARGGRIETDKSWGLLRAFGKRHRAKGQILAALIGASPRLQESERMLNTSLTIAPRQPIGHAQFWGMRMYNRVKHDLAPTKRARSLWLGTKKAVHIVQRTLDPARPWLLHKLGQVELALLVRAEQAPNRESRVTLADERDPLGVPRVKLDWRLSELDVHSVERLVDALGRETERLGIGRTEPAEWLDDPLRRWQTDPLVSAHPIGGYHHMGTTRMADDPREGVTDSFGRVHGVDNLFVAGSSLFPTSGWANPTLTIAALALRTAERIGSELG